MRGISPRNNLPGPSSPRPRGLGAAPLVRKRVFLTFTSFLLDRDLEARARAVGNLPLGFGVPLLGFSLAGAEFGQEFNLRRAGRQSTVAEGPADEISVAVEGAHGLGHARLSSRAFWAKVKDQGEVLDF